MRNVKILSFFYILTVLGLFFYSFTQIDLSLTFSRITLLRQIVTSFQYIGYFNRPLSTDFYLIILIALYCAYFGFLYLAHHKKISRKFVWQIIIATTGILVLSYNAFSYDIFNYIFDAKIITHYQQNPYLHKALDFPGDPMLSFMRWTHRVYPYGPVWLALTVPLSYLGMQFFLPTFFLFKLLMAFSFVGSVWFAEKILQKIMPEKSLLGLVLLGLQPLILIESLVSGHLDIVMFFFALWSLYLLLQKRYIWAFVLLAISIGIKFVTLFLLPIFIYIVVAQHFKKKVVWQHVFLMSVLFMAFSVIAASVRTTFQPWYIIAPLIFAPFVVRYFVFIPSIILSFVAMLTYVPFLFNGNWDSPIPQNLATMYNIGLIIAVLSVITYKVVRKK